MTTCNKVQSLLRFFKMLEATCLELRWFEKRREVAGRHRFNTRFRLMGPGAKTDEAGRDGKSRVTATGRRSRHWARRATGWRAKGAETVEVHPRLETRRYWRNPVTERADDINGKRKVATAEMRRARQT